MFTLVYIILVFLADSPISYGLVALFCILVILLSKIKFSVVIKSVKPMFFVILITAIINVFFTGGTDVLWSYKFIKITKLGV